MGQTFGKKKILSSETENHTLLVKTLYIAAPAPLTIPRTEALLLR